ncbi:MAG: response regulator, partial [Desulfobulbaceae bacterium]|nr:response regulator [Desulfobulbaceae bacterium]
MAEKTQPSMKEKGNILFVGGNSFVRDSFITLFEREGYDCKSVSMAKDALQLLKINRFTIVLIDTPLADMNGLDLCRRIHRLYPAKRQLLFVDYQNRPTVREACEAGIVDWIEKPVSSSAVD